MALKLGLRLLKNSLISMIGIELKIAQLLRCIDMDL